MAFTFGVSSVQVVNTYVQVNSLPLFRQYNIPFTRPTSVFTRQNGGYSHHSVVSALLITSKVGGYSYAKKADRKLTDIVRETLLLPYPATRSFDPAPVQ